MKKQPDFDGSFETIIEEIHFTQKGNLFTSGSTDFGSIVIFSAQTFPELKICLEDDSKHFKNFSETGMNHVLNFRPEKFTHENLNISLIGEIVDTHLTCGQSKTEIFFWVRSIRVSKGPTLFKTFNVPQ